MVAVAGYSIETPRLLLLSASRRFPDGLCNDFDQVGRYLMVQGAPQTAGRFEAEVRMYKAPPPEVSSEQFYETDPTKPYKRGWSIQTVSPLPITWSEHVTAQGHWGDVLREYMRDYVHWATLGALCEFLPQARNRVTLADETDRHGLPVDRRQADLDRLQQAAAVVRQFHVTRAPHEQSGAQLFFQPLDLPTDGRLGDEQFGRCRTETKPPRNRFETAQCAERERPAAWGFHSFFASMDDSVFIGPTSTARA